MRVIETPGGVDEIATGSLEVYMGDGVDLVGESVWIGWANPEDCRLRFEADADYPKSAFANVRNGSVYFRLEKSLSAAETIKINWTLEKLRNAYVQRGYQTSGGTPTIAPVDPERASFTVQDWHRGGHFHALSSDGAQIVPDPSQGDIRGSWELIEYA